MEMHDTGRAWIEIDKGNLIHNVKELQRLSGAGCALMPAVKANAYGHGDVLISRILQEAGISNFCTASVDEAIRLRKAGISGQILILGYTDPDGFSELGKYRLTQTVVDLNYARRLSEYGSRTKGFKGWPEAYRDDKAEDSRIMTHVGVDTGMHRLGISYSRQDQIEENWRMPGVSVAGIFSHLCVSDGLTDREEKYTREQIRRFYIVTERLHQKGIHGFQTHIQGSYGLLNYPEYAFDLARPGIALYGCLSSAADQVRTTPDLRPVLSLKVRAASVKELGAGESAGYGLDYTADSPRKIAIVSIGYADGIPRSLSNRGHALIRGKRVPVIGRICMDQLTLDVTDVPGVLAGDEVVFIGRSPEKRDADGKEPAAVITAEEMAEAAGTITNEILSRLGERLTRIAA